jgi:hypothetical protein
MQTDHRGVIEALMAKGEALMRGRDLQNQEEIEAAEEIIERAKEITESEDRVALTAVWQRIPRRSKTSWSRILRIVVNL